jgi:hypothetical protein
MPIDLLSHRHKSDPTQGHHTFEPNFCSSYNNRVTIDDARDTGNHPRCFGLAGKKYDEQSYAAKGFSYAHFLLNAVPINIHIDLQQTLFGIVKHQSRNPGDRNANGAEQQHSEPRRNNCKIDQAQN